ncbi:peptidylprolyl isomerase [Fuscovulum ytuae]|uniref:Peptidyl-prolyl cis-trans isomerase n=1 Tax=Fuscovulum ytuae TaxID=3042299 RepID=A0ABY8Q859_9RHOB|nr:peptidylprolyl isomerase [Fuscovulum sp. YMD61]WGV17071.1 peptidylprolyl isomerase [Fuscovulum sp. YMD61]
MFSDRVIVAGLFAVGLAVVGGFALSQSAVAQDVVDGPGPNLVIEVAGSVTGTVVIDMASDVAPNHVAQITQLAKDGAYDGVVFHRVIDGFMAQTGDVEFGRQGGDLSMAGMGGSAMPDLAAEFSSMPFDRGVVGMARSMNPNSANSQFFIMFAPAPHLDGQYTVVGHVVSGMDVVDAIKKGDQAANGAVDAPDYMASVTVIE